MPNAARKERIVSDIIEAPVEPGTLPEQNAVVPVKRRGRPAKALAPNAPVPVVVGEGPQAFLSAVVQMAANPQLDASKLEKLLAMQEHLEAKQAEKEFNEALRAAQQEVPRVQKNGKVNLGDGKGGYAFATWEDMDTILRPVMLRHGFSLSFDTMQREGGGLIVSGTLTHTSGHSRTVSMPLALDTGAGRNNLQATGSSLSYGRRYVAEMLFNIVRTGADDDATTADPISAEQAEELLLLLEETGTRLGAFLEVMVSNAQSVEEIQKADFVRVKNALLAKKTKLAHEHKEAA